MTLVIREHNCGLFPHLITFTFIHMYERLLNSMYDKERIIYQLERTRVLSLQMIERVPHAKHDIRLDAVLTEGGVFIMEENI